MRRIIPLSQAVHYNAIVKGMEEKGIRQHQEQELLARNYILLSPSQTHGPEAVSTASPGQWLAWVGIFHITFCSTAFDINNY